MVKLYPPILASPTLLAQLDDISRDPRRCVSYSPFGTFGLGTMFTRTPPVIKGMKGVKGQGVPEEIRRSYPGIAAGLGRAISMSKSHTEHGTALRSVRGVFRYMPRKAAEMHDVRVRA